MMAAALDSVLKNLLPFRLTDELKQSVEFFNMTVAVSGLCSVVAVLSCGKLQRHVSSKALIGGLLLLDATQYFCLSAADSPGLLSLCFIVHRCCVKVAGGVASLWVARATGVESMVSAFAAQKLIGSVLFASVSAGSASALPFCTISQLFLVAGFICIFCFVLLCSLSEPPPLQLERTRQKPNLNNSLKQH